MLNLFYGSGEPLWQWGFLTITQQGIFNAIFIAVRIAGLVLFSSVLTFTDVADRSHRRDGGGF